MCTGTDSTNQPSSSKSKEHKWDRALYMLNELPWPCNVQVHSEIPPQLGDKLEVRRIRLNQADVMVMKEKYNHKYSNVSNEMVVPLSCLIRPVSVANEKNELHEVFSHPYNSIALTNVNNGDVVAWALAPVSEYARSELIPCVLYFSGKQTREPFSSFAFVIPQKNVHVTVLPPCIESKKISECEWDEEKMYRVPLRDIYHWEDINMARRQIHGVTLELRETTDSEWYKKSYEFINKVPAELHEQPVPNLMDVSYPDTEKNVEGLGISNEVNSNNLLHKLSGDSPLTKEKIREGDILDSVDEAGHREFEVNGDLVKAGGSSSAYPGVADPLMIQKDYIPNDYTTEGTKPFQNSESSNRKDKTYSSVARRKSQSSNEDNIVDESYKIICFGYCFTVDLPFIEVTVDEIQKGDTVVATCKDRDGILGNVLMTCELPSLKKNQIFVGVKFEDKVNTHPFTVRHAWGDENNCFDHCGIALKVFIPIQHLSPNSSSNKYLHVIRNSMKSESRRKSLLVSDIHVDFNFEASRRDFVTTSVDYMTPEMLQRMGIEGNVNSCYIDAVLFALYVFSTNFDGGLQGPVHNLKHPAEMNVVIEAARNLLKYDIVTPLRCAHKVSWVHVYKLRLALAEIFNDKGYLGNFMDAETFVTSLFSQVLQVPEFFQLGEDTKDYILQLFPPIANENSEENKIDRSCVQSLLQEYFHWAGVKLQEVPKVGFLIKLPVSNGVPHFKYVFPNIKLRLGKRLLEKKDKNERFMTLRAVICLKKNHFTCFVRTEANAADATTGKATWYFHDSMAMAEGPSILTECPSLEIALETVAPHFGIKVPGDGNNDRENVGLEEANKWLDILLTTAYICVYEPPRNETYL